MRAPDGSVSGKPSGEVGVRSSLFAAIAEQLRGRDHDVVAVIERGWEQEADESLLAICNEEARALLTNNVGDFVAVVRLWAVESRSHPGLIFTSDASMPRHRDSIGGYVAALDEVLRLHPEIEALRDRILWL